MRHVMKDAARCPGFFLPEWNKCFSDGKDKRQYSGKRVLSVEDN